MPGDHSILFECLVIWGYGIGHFFLGEASGVCTGRAAVWKVRYSCGPRSDSCSVVRFINSCLRFFSPVCSCLIMGERACQIAFYCMLFAPESIGIRDSLLVRSVWNKYSKRGRKTNHNLRRSTMVNVLSVVRFAVKTFFRAVCCADAVLKRVARPCRFSHPAGTTARVCCP